MICYICEKIMVLTRVILAGSACDRYYCEGCKNVGTASFGDSSYWHKERLSSVEFEKTKADLAEAVTALEFYHRTGTWENYGELALEDSGTVAGKALVKI